MSEAKKQKNFFIDLSTLHKIDASLPFDLYLFQPVSGTFSLELEAGSLMTQEQLDYLAIISQRGGRVAVPLEAMTSYLMHTNLTQEDIPGLDFKKHPLYLLMLKHQEEFRELLETPYNYLEGVRGIVRTEDFSELIMRVKAEICQYPFTKSPIVSLAHRLATDYLNDQKIMNKTVALVYAFARLLGMEDQEELSHLVVATFYRDIGITQVSYEQFINQNPNDNLERGFQKHPALSLFLLNKSNLSLPPRTMKIIMDHHELFNGRGYSAGKKGPQLDLLPQIIGLADHITAFASGLIVPGTSSYLKVFKGLARQTQITGLQHGYHPSLTEILIKIVMEFD